MERDEGRAYCKDCGGIRNEHRQFSCPKAQDPLDQEEKRYSEGCWKASHTEIHRKMSKRGGILHSWMEEEREK